MLGQLPWREVTWAALVARNLWRRPVRTCLTVVGVALGVALIVALFSVSNGVGNTARDLIHVGRADFGVYQQGASDPTTSLLPETLGSRLRSVPGVADVAAIDIHFGRVQGHASFLVFGLNRDEFAFRRFVIVNGIEPRDNEAVVGDLAASSLQVKPGDSLRVDNSRFRIAGIYHSGDHFEDIGLTLPLQVVQTLSSEPSKVNTFGVTVDLGKRPASVAKLIERRLPGTTALYEPGQVIKIDTSSALIVNLGWIFTVLAIVIGGISVTNTMAMSVFERVHEIGIMRAIGWPGWRIAALIISESIGIGLLALAGGLAGGYLAADQFIQHSSLADLAQPDFTAGVFIWGLAFALGVALIGSLYPALHAIRLSPIDALRR